MNYSPSYEYLAQLFFDETKYKGTLNILNSKLKTVNVMMIHSYIQNCHQKKFKKKMDSNRFHYITINENDKFGIYWMHEDDILTSQDKLQLNSSRSSAIFLHGAGQSSWTWASTFKELEKILQNHKDIISINCIAIDMRGHGTTDTSDDANLKLSVVVNDFINVLTFLTQTHTKPHSIYLIGHSLGGALTCWISDKLLNHNHPSLSVAGIFAVDVVEALAINSLHSTRHHLECRPKGFNSIDDAVEWAIQDHYMLNPESAQLSLPGQLWACEQTGLYQWRTNLLLSLTFWEEWFQGLSEAFVHLPLVNKILLVSNSDTLDRTLIVGQMQGKYKLLLFARNNIGHFIQEDAPAQTACALFNFFARKSILSICF